jgi:hypothetical protein
MVGARVTVEADSTVDAEAAGSAAGLGVANKIWS